jgi:hypothetical protein
LIAYSSGRHSEAEVGIKAYWRRGKTQGKIRVWPCMDISFTNPDVLQAGITAGQATKMIVPFSYCAGDFLQ